MGSVPGREDSTCHGATKPMYYRYALLNPRVPEHVPHHRRHYNESLHMPPKGWTLLAATRKLANRMMAQHSQKEPDKPLKKKICLFIFYHLNRSMRNYFSVFFL